MADEKQRDLKISAFKCSDSDCALEFVIVCLNAIQDWDEDAPHCPHCGESDAVKIDCLDITLKEKVQEYEIIRVPKPLAQ